MDKLIDALIGETTGSAKFEHLATEIFLEQAKFRNLDIEYFVPFFCSLAIFLGADDVRQKYGLEKTFFGWYPESNTLKLVFAKNSILRVRSFFLGEIKPNAPRLLSEKEYLKLKSLIRSYEINRWVNDNYRKQIGRGAIGADVTFDTYLKHYLDQFSLPENADFFHNFQTYLDSHADMIDNYRKDYKEYLIQNIKSENTGDRTVPIFSEAFSKDLTIRTIQDRMTFANPASVTLTDFYPETSDSPYWDSMVITENIGFILGENMLSSLSKIYNTLNFLDVRKGYMKNIFENIGQIYSIADIWMGRQYFEREHWREAAFTHGALLALNVNRETANIKIVETTNEDGQSSELMVVMEPKLQSNIIAESSVLSFTEAHFTSRDLVLSNLQNTISGKYHLMKLDYRDGLVSLHQKIFPKELDFLQELMIQLNLNARPAGIWDFVSERLDRLIPDRAEHDITNINFLSRYFLGMLSTLDKNDNVEIFLIKPIDAHTNSYFAKINLGNQVFQTKHVLLNIHEKMEAFDPLDVAASTSYEYEGDTVVIDIFHSFMKSSTSSGYLMRNVRVGFTSLSSLPIDEQILSTIDHFPVDTYLKSYKEDHLRGFYNHIFSYISKYAALIYPSVFDGADPYDYASNFKATLEGIFHRQLKSKNRLTLDPSLSTIQYTFNLNSNQNAQAKVDDVIEYSDSESETSSDESDWEERETIAEETIDPAELVTVNFKFSSRKFEGRSLYAMYEMLGKKDKVIMKNFHIDLSMDHERLDGNLLTEEDFTAQCSRVKRANAACSGVASEGDPEIVEFGGNWMKGLENVASICNYMMMGFMVRDLIADVAKGEKLSAVKDTAFILGATFSSTFGSILTKKGASLMADGAKFSGLATKALGFGISRAISLYVLFDFGSNLVHYLHNKNDTSAKIGMAVDGAFLTIDAITAAVEGLEAAQLISGVSAVTGPMGIIAGTALILGMNIYQTVSQTRAIDNMIHLSMQELFDESFRAFLHLDPASNIRELIDEKAANEYLAEKATKFLNTQEQYSVIVMKSGEIVNKQMKIKSHSIIDLQRKVPLNISRASPVVNKSMQVICPVHEESSEIAKPNFWTRLETSIANVATKIEHYMITINNKFSSNKFHENLIPHSRIGYSCHNAFGVKRAGDTKNSDAAYFQLGDGHDFVKGFPNTRNVFHLGAGKKFILGGRANDRFILTSDNASGLLHGATGFDIVDFSSLNGTVVHFNDKRLHSDHKLSLKLHDIEWLIGRQGLVDKIVIEDCTMQAISTLGGSRLDPDRIVLQKANCTFNLTLALEGHSVLVNHATSGNFTYIISNQPRTNVHIYLFENTTYNRIVLQQNFTKMVKMEHMEKDTFHKVVFHYRSQSKLEILYQHTLNNTIISFSDGSMLLFSPNSSMLIVNSDVGMQKVLRGYKNKVKHLGIQVLLAHSNIDNESVVYTPQNSSARLLHLLHNSLEHKTRLLLEHGRYLVLINATMKNGTLNFPQVTMESSTLHTSSVTLDFNLLVQQYGYLNLTTTPLIIGRKVKNDLEIEVIDTEFGYLIGKVCILDAYSGDLYKNIIIQSLAMLRVRITKEFNEYDTQHPATTNNELEVIERQMTLQDHLIILTNDNVEWFDRIYINLTIDRLDFYHINHISLIVTNAALARLIGIQNVCTLIIENFFLSRKLQTLTIRTSHQNVNFAPIIRELENAAGIEDFWKSNRKNRIFF